MAKRKEDRVNNGNVHPNRIFKEPIELYRAFEAYKTMRQNEATSWPKVSYVGKDAQRVEDYPVMPYTLESFYAYCYPIYGVVQQYIENREGYYEDFIGISEVIKNECKAQLTTGGLLGHFNQSLTARIHGYTDRQDHTTNGKEISNQPLQIEIVKPDKED